MTATIEINANDLNRHLPAGCLNELAYLLGLLVPWGQRLTWAILDLEAIGQLSDGTNMLDLERQVAESPTDLVLDWDALVALADDFSQVINAVILGCSDAASIPPLGPRIDLAASGEIVVEAIDSSLWRVTAQAEQVLAQLPGQRLVSDEQHV